MAVMTGAVPLKLRLTGAASRERRQGAHAQQKREQNASRLTKPASETYTETTARADSACLHGTRTRPRVTAGRVSRTS